MSVYPTTQASRRAAIATIVAALALPGVASAANPTVTHVDGNPRCADVGSGSQSLKIDPVPQGLTSFGNGSFSGQMTVNGRVLDWSSSDPIEFVIVKGGPNANVYRYTPGATGGQGLHAPVNPHNGQFYGLSHVDFCHGSTPPPPPPGPCQPGGPAKKPNGKPCTPPPPPGPCQTGGPTTMPDGTPCDKVIPPPPTREVLGATESAPRVRAAAHLRSARRCVRGAYTQVLSGRGIRRVTVKVNGHSVGRMRKKGSRYTIRIKTRRFHSRVLHVKARVQYVAASGRRPQTLRTTVLRCARRDPAVRFTG